MNIRTKIVSGILTVAAVAVATAAGTGVGLMFSSPRLHVDTAYVTSADGFAPLLNNLVHVTGGTDPLAVTR